MNTHPRASHPARRSGRLSDPQGSRPVTFCASVSLARLIGATRLRGAATRATTCGPAVKVGRAAFF